jgi:hypothetical protein
VHKSPLPTRPLQLFDKVIIHVRALLDGATRTLSASGYAVTTGGGEQIRSTPGRPMWF